MSSPEPLKSASVSNPPLQSPVDAPSRWDKIAAMPEFKQLTIKKARFILAATLFFLVYYFALPVLVGYFPKLMETRVGSVNIAYLFALSQFFMAWALAIIYVKVAAKWDADAAAILREAKEE